LYFGSVVLAQRRPVLPQIDLPHPYYYREMYLPQLTSGPSSVAWSPDSRDVVYSMAGSLWRQKIDSNVAKQLTDGPGYDYQPDWSPDGKSVVYVSYQKDAMELWLLDLASGKSRQLTEGGAVNVEPRWSPDGKRIAYVSTAYNKRFHIFRTDVNDGRLENVVRLTGETKSTLPRYYYSAYDMEISPVWTRDGREILFVSNRGHIHGTGGFWRMRAEPGAKSHEIHYEETNWKAQPDFSPDGSRMAYSSYLGRQWHQVWLVPTNGSDAFPVSYGDWDATSIRWAPDGNKIAYISNETGNTSLVFQTIPGADRTSLRIETRQYLRPHSRLDISVAAKDKTQLRMSVVDASGKFHAPDDAWIIADDGFDRKERPFEAHYFHTPSTAHLEVPAGTITIEVMRGFEYGPVKQTIEVQEGKASCVVLPALKQIWDPHKDSGQWVSGDLHVHMNYGGAYRNTPAHLAEQAEAENLNIANDLIVNKEQRFPDSAYGGKGVDPASRQGALVIHGQEFHTSYWGHRGILNLHDHLLLPGYAGYPNTAASSLYPMNADVFDMAHAQGALVGAVHPFDEAPNPFANPPQKITDELPVDVALGKLDYMEIVGFSDHKATAEIWYRLLNLGFRIPAGAGTDAIANNAAPIRGHVGMNRVYVKVPPRPIDANMVNSWFEALKQGRTFATNGPLLEFAIGDAAVGDDLHLKEEQTVSFKASLRSIVPVDHLEIVCDGKVAKEIKLEGNGQSADTEGTLQIKGSGWCVLRAWTENARYPVMDKYAYATTSPIYLTVDGKKPRLAEDAKYFEAWIDRTIEVTTKYPDWNSPAEKEYVLNRLKEARTIYQDLQ
jgi:TolB protein